MRPVTTQSKGLKDMVAEATQTKAAQPEPVDISSEAIHALAEKMREWSGWTNAPITIGDPRKYGVNSPWAACHWDHKAFIINVDRLVLNPNRVLRTVTPFRLRQEAVLTGALLHEAGHARHSLWIPRTPEQAAVFKHSDGTDVTAQEMALARAMEEPRVEGLQFRDADHIGAAGLGWTMRAAAAHLLPMTTLSADPDQKIMDLVTSWAYRAGRQYALHFQTGHNLRNWVGQFTSLVHNAIAEHLEQFDSVADPVNDAREIVALLLDMASCDDDRGPTMVDLARTVLTLLFPETEPEDQPEAGEGCGQAASEEEQSESESESGEGGEGDEEGEQGEGNTEPEDEGSGEEPGAGDSGQDEDAEPEREDENGEPTSEDESGSNQPEQDSEPEQEDGSPSEGEAEDEGATGSTDEAGPESGTDTASELAKALREMEADADADTEDEASEEGEAEADEQASGAGAGASATHQYGWRNPTAAERETQKMAERFLRDLIAPSESSKIVLTESPSATVDGAALAAWRAGGQSRDPRFFVRTKRAIEPSPPVRIAILVDVSTSMDDLAEPAAVLSWAAANAALDLRNFAGRGQQVESCLIHWGNTARVIQHNGQTMPGIREWQCAEGTYAMGHALRLVEEEMPGFFDITEKPVNRLLVQFTDWELFGRVPDETDYIRRAMEAGVNMLTIAPQGYSPKYADLDTILRACRVKRGVASLFKYNPMFPDQVWQQAAEALA